MCRNLILHFFVNKEWDDMNWNNFGYKRILEKIYLTGLIAKLISLRSKNKEWLEILAKRIWDRLVKGEKNQQFVLFKSWRVSWNVRSFFLAMSSNSRTSCFSDISLKNLKLFCFENFLIIFLTWSHPWSPSRSQSKFPCTGSVMPSQRRVQNVGRTSHPLPKSPPIISKLRSKAILNIIKFNVKL